jgi:hypothetical protein
MITLGAAMMIAAAGSAQDRLKTKITAKANDSVISYTITSQKEFYVGGNKHYLRIGSKHFDIYQQNNDEGRGRLTFLIPKADFAALPEGANVYMTYGDIEGDGFKNLDELCHQNLSPCWSLGKLNKKITTIK